MSKPALQYPTLPGLDLSGPTKEPPDEQPVNPAREFKPKQSNDIALYICHQQEAEEIFQRKTDGYLDATAMCRAYNKRFSNWRQLDGTAEFLEALGSDTGIPTSLLVESNRAGPYSTRGTWVHPEVAIELAGWLSKIFRVKVNRWWLQWAQGRQPTFSRDDIEPFVIGSLLKRMDDRLARLENGAIPRLERAAAQTNFILWQREGSDPNEVRLTPAPPPMPRTDAPPSRSGLPPLAQPRQEFNGPPNRNYRKGE